jgi:hypothetical protein
VALEIACSFDEAGTTVIDYSGNGRNFALTANATRVPGHGTGNAVRSAGATQVPMPDIGVSDQRTVMAWVKGDISAEDAWLVEWHVNSIDSGAWGIVTLSGDIAIQAENSTTQARASAAWPDTTGWHHVAGTFDGSMVCLYLDGALADCTPLAGPIRTDSNAPALLGRSDTVAVDDVRVYSNCLDIAAINAAKDAIVTADDFANSAVLAVTDAFISRVRVAMAHYAVQIGTAFLAAPTTSGTDKARYLLSRDVLLDPVAWGTRFAWAVAADAGVDGTVDDATITSKVAGVWNLFAGVPV